MRRFLKSKRGLSRFFWSQIGRVPPFLQRTIMRKSFRVTYDLSHEYIFKVAETVDEIRDGLAIIYDAYKELDYIDPNGSQLHFTPFMILPSTIFLVVKKGEEVIATMSIIQDSPLGLPMDATWSLEALRTKGLLLAEIASFSVKKGYRSKRGELTFPLMKLMTIICRKFLKVDGIIMATTLEVKPFYQHILLFEDLPLKGGSHEHSLVKGNPSYGGYLDLGEGFVTSYFATYAQEKKTRNLYHYFLVYEFSQIKLPKEGLSLHPMEQALNRAKAQLLERYGELLTKVEGPSVAIIKNMDSESHLKVADQVIEGKENEFLSIMAMRKAFRYRVRRSVFISPLLEDPSQGQPSTEGMSQSMPPSMGFMGDILEISRSGLLIRLRAAEHERAKTGETLALRMIHDKWTIELEVEVRWVRFKKFIGCTILKSDSYWDRFLDELEREIKETGS